MPKKEIKHLFEGWFSVTMPENWNYDIDEDILNIYSIDNAKGTIQVSFFHRKELEESLRKTAEKHLNRFVTQHNIKIEINTRKVIEAPCYTVANTSGEYDGEFIKVWTVVNEQKMLLITYISPKKTRELSTAENIVYSINFSDGDSGRHGKDILPVPMSEEQKFQD